jgi:hypothetical protein
MALRDRGKYLERCLQHVSQVGQPVVQRDGYVRGVLHRRKRGPPRAVETDPMVRHRPELCPEICRSIRRAYTVGAGRDTYRQE